MPKNPQKIASMRCDKKETGCTRASAADRFDLHQVGDGVHECVYAGANGPE